MPLLFYLQFLQLTFTPIHQLSTSNRNELGALHPCKPQHVMQVLAEVKPVTLPYTPDEKVGFILRKRHWLPLVKAARADRVQMHYPQVRKLTVLQLLHV